MNKDLIPPDPNSFAEIAKLIQDRRARVVRAVNTELIDLYWEIGKILSHKVELAEWGRGTVTELANFLKRTEPGIKGFSASNLWRMRQFHETYRDNEKLAPLVRQLPWPSNFFIIADEYAKHAEKWRCHAI